MEGDLAITARLMDREYVSDSSALAQYSDSLCHSPDTDDYYISKLSTTNKHTLGCYRCMAALLVGQHMEDAKEVSRIGHLSGVIVKSRSGFYDMFSRGLEYFGKSTKDGTRQIATAGGLYAIGQDGVDYRSECLDMIDLIAERTHAVLGLPVTVLSLPKQGAGATDVYYVTAKRLALLVQDARENLCDETGILASDIRSYLELQ
jgi:hypothetical protein